MENLPIPLPWRNSSSISSRLLTKLASACFEKATLQVFAVDTKGNRGGLLDINLARACAVLSAGEQALVIVAESVLLCAGEEEDDGGVESRHGASTGMEAASSPPLLQPKPLSNLPTFTSCVLNALCKDLNCVLSLTN